MTTMPEDQSRPTSPTVSAVRVVADQDRPVIEVTVASPIDVVWPHLRDPELIRRWHGWEDPSLDAEIDFIYRQHSEADDEAHVIRSKGWPEPGAEDLGDRFDVTAAGPEETVVRITRGPRGVNADWDAMYDDITEGWISFLAQLKFAVERHRGVDRRTVFRSWSGEPGPRIQDLWAADPAPPASGATWLDTDGQLGFVVDAYGPGLVVLADKPGPEPGTAVSSMAIVSTYGLGESEQAEVESAWAAWWSARHPEQPGD
ncbi:SRPBCC family protein [Microlunatus ginsengisoli]